MDLDVVSRLKAERAREDDLNRPICIHCFHSLPSYAKRWKWECCHCHEKATRVLADYYTISYQIGDNASPVVV